MSNVHVTLTPVKIGDSTLKVVKYYTQTAWIIIDRLVECWTDLIRKLDRSNFEKEVNCRIQLVWAVLEKLSQILQCLKTKVFDQRILPVITYDIIRMIKGCYEKPWGRSMSSSDVFWLRWWWCYILLSGNRISKEKKTTYFFLSTLDSRAIVLLQYTSFSRQ